MIVFLFSVKPELILPSAGPGAGSTTSFFEPASTSTRRA